MDRDRVIRIKEMRHGYRITMEKSPLRPLVQKLGEQWSCSCKPVGHRHSSGGCNHIYAVLEYLLEKEEAATTEENSNLLSF